MTVGGWMPGRVVEAIPATHSARILRLDVPGWPGNDAGQHVDIRLTAEDGYQAVRSYSLGSYGASETVELAVDEIPDGEVSPYLVEDVLPGDELEVKGPLGGYFVWRPGGEAPVQLIAGGSGIVPMMAMVRAATDAGAAASVRLLYSVRTTEDAIYRDELSSLSGDGGVGLTWRYTRAAPDGWQGAIGRVDAELLRTAVWSPDRQPVVYVCGPTGFVEHVADALVGLGHASARIRTERFGGA
ncbi:ferredoxin reductase [Microbacterium trichothecenolyticum]|uniref:ferredoxin reductase n=1 Tax=Microbacterium trichothecenolyticum TaxID=69370 RepID=UPI001C6DF613|nr:ferredoxin reductase [Microbacterium trichothecenolyticum]MBW9119078.1 ferredoxin reductase [Microbacterium trichothecenolyticum]